MTTRISVSTTLQNHFQSHHICLPSPSSNLERNLLRTSLVSHRHHLQNSPRSWPSHRKSLTHHPHRLLGPPSPTTLLCATWDTQAPHGRDMISEFTRPTS